MTPLELLCWGYVVAAVLYGAHTMYYLDSGKARDAFIYRNCATSAHIVASMFMGALWWFFLICDARIAWRRRKRLY